MRNETLPMNSLAFSNFIETSKIFEKTTAMMKTYLSNWYAENEEDFLKCMGATIDVVLNEYSLHNQSVHFVKNLNFDEPDQDYIYCIIDILNPEGNRCVGYKAVFDDHLNGKDDMLC